MRRDPEAVFRAKDREFSIFLARSTSVGSVFDALQACGLESIESAPATEFKSDMCQCVIFDSSKATRNGQNQKGYNLIGCMQKSPTDSQSLIWNGKNESKKSLGRSIYKQQNGTQHEHKYNASVAQICGIWFCRRHYRPWVFWEIFIFFYFFQPHRKITNIIFSMYKLAGCLATYLWRIPF